MDETAQYSKEPEPQSQPPAGSNAFMDYLTLAFNILKLDEGAVMAAAKDEGATMWALLVVAIAGMGPAVGQMMFPMLIIGPAFSIAGSFLGFGVIWLLGKLFGGKGDFISFYRAQGLSHVAMWVNFIPILGPLLMLIVICWNFVVSVNNLRLTQKLSIPIAVLAVVLPGCLLLAGMLFMFIVFGAAILAFFGLAAHGAIHGPQAGHVNFPASFQQTVSESRPAWPNGENVRPMMTQAPPASVPPPAPVVPARPKTAEELALEEQMEGFEKTTWGMTYDQAASLLEAPVRKESVACVDQVAFGLPSKAVLSFVDDKLALAVIKFKPSESNGSNFELDCEALENTLKRHYGARASLKRVWASRVAAADQTNPSTAAIARGDLTVCSTWLSPQTEAELVYGSNGQRTSISMTLSSVWLKKFKEKAEAQALSVKLDGPVEAGSNAQTHAAAVIGDFVEPKPVVRRGAR